MRKRSKRLADSQLVRSPVMLGYTYDLNVLIMYENVLF